MSYQLTVEEMDQALALAHAFAQASDEGGRAIPRSVLPAPPNVIENACCIFLKFADTPGFRQHVASTRPAHLYLFDPKVRSLLAASLVLSLPLVLPDEEVAAYNQYFAEAQAGTISIERGSVYFSVREKMLEEGERIQKRLEENGISW